MIDVTDNQTQSITLDEKQNKRGRGRPATGQAQTNADRQRAYRERQKEQRNAKGDYTREQVQEAVQEYQDIINRLQEQLIEAEKDMELKNKQLKIWIERATEAEKELSQRDGNQLFHMEYKEKGRRTWRRVGGKTAEPEERHFCEKFIEKSIKDGSDFSYRIVPA